MRKLARNHFIVWLLIFSLWPMSPAFAAKHCKTIWERTVHALSPWKWGRPESVVGAGKDATYSLELEKRIRKWGNAAGRTSSHREVKRSRIASFVLKSLEFDRYFVAVEYLKSNFLEMQLSFALYKLNTRILNGLDLITANLRADGSAANIAALKKFAAKFDIDDAAFNAALATGDATKILAAAVTLKKQIQDHSKAIAMNVAWHFDEYEASRSMLETCKENGTKGVGDRQDLADKLDEKRAVAALESVQLPLPEGTEPAPAAGESRPLDKPIRRKDFIGKQAEKVLDRLTTDRLLEGYAIAKLLSKEEMETPSTKDFKQILKDHPDAADNRRRWTGDREFFAWILSISPTDAAINWFDKSAARMPYLNHPKFRAFLQYALSETHVEMYYPDIARVVDSTAGPRNTLEMVEIMNAGTEDRFIVTLRRRLDARAEWERIKDVARERADQDFFHRMEKAEVTAKTLGDLNPWQTESNRATKFFRRMMDTAIASGVIGGGAWLTSPMWSKEKNDAIEQITGDDDKNGGPLTDEERRELEELEHDASKFLDWLKENPEGQELFKRYLEEKKQREAERKKKQERPADEPSEEPSTPPEEEPETKKRRTESEPEAKKRPTKVEPEEPEEPQEPREPENEPEPGEGSDEMDD